MIDPCHICLIAIWKQGPIHTLAADHVNIFCSDIALIPPEENPYHALPLHLSPHNLGFPVSTILVRFLSGCPPGKLSRVFLPITTTFTALWSHGKTSCPAECLPDSLLPYPIAQFLSTATIKFISRHPFLSILYCILYCYRNILDLFMRLIINQCHIIPCKLIKVLNLRIQPELRCRERFSADQFLNHRNVSVINMRICNHMHQFAQPSYHIPAPAYGAARHTDIHSSYLPSAHPANAGSGSHSASVYHCPASFVTLKCHTVRTGIERHLMQILVHINICHNPAAVRIMSSDHKSHGPPDPSSPPCTDASPPSDSHKPCRWNHSHLPSCPRCDSLDSWILLDFFCQIHEQSHPYSP